MTLNRRVHFLIDPKHYAAMEELVRVRWKATGKRITAGTLLREAVADYLSKHSKRSGARSSKRQK